ncbi:MAG: hypothetical protein ACR2FU_23230 [Streptosporangiaceae bacterium]
MDQPLAYARRILVNLVIDGSKARARRRADLAARSAARTLDVPDEAAARMISAADARLDLIDALMTLTPRQRAVLVMRYWADLPEANLEDELRSALTRRPDTVPSRISDELRLVNYRPRTEHRAIAGAAGAGVFIPLNGGCLHVRLAGPAVPPGAQPVAVGGDRGFFEPDQPDGTITLYIDGSTTQLLVMTATGTGLSEQKLIRIAAGSLPPCSTGPGNAPSCN